MTYKTFDNKIEIGKLALENRDYSIATEIFSKAIIDGNLDEPNFWYWLAESLYYQKQFESALKCWHEAAIKDPTNKKTWIRISALYALMDCNDLALYYYKIAEGLLITE